MHIKNIKIIFQSIFDDDNNGTVDYKELIMGLEIFKENSIEEKLKGFKNSKSFLIFINSFLRFMRC